MVEVVRSVRIRIEVDTNKRTIESDREFENAAEAVKWLEDNDYWIRPEA